MHSYKHSHHSDKKAQTKNSKLIKISPTSLEPESKENNRPNNNNRYDIS